METPLSRQKITRTHHGRQNTVSQGFTPAGTTTNYPPPQSPENNTFQEFKTTATIPTYTPVASVCLTDLRPPGQLLITPLLSRQNAVRLQDLITPLLSRQHAVRLQDLMWIFYNV